MQYVRTLSAESCFFLALFLLFLLNKQRFFYKSIKEVDHV